MGGGFVIGGADELIVSMAQNLPETLDLKLKPAILHRAYPNTLYRVTDLNASHPKRCLQECYTEKQNMSDDLRYMTRTQADAAVA